MPYKKKTNHKRKKLLLIIGIIVTVLVLIAAAVLVIVTYQKDQEAKAAAALDALPRIVVPEGHFAPATYESTLQKDIKAAKLTPKTDLYVDPNADQTALEKEVDGILANMKKLSFNSIVLDTRLDDSVIFDSGKLQKTPVDILSILLAKAKEQEMTVSVIFHLTGVNAADGTPVKSHLLYENRQLMADAMAELAKKYEIESILLDDYYTGKGGDAYAEYVSYGGAITGQGFEDWLVDSTNIAIDVVKSQTKLAKSSLPVGLLIKNVWANAEGTEGGSATKAEFQALKNGHANTKALVESGIADFINVEIKTPLSNESEPFKAIANWWGGICKAANKPMYVTHSGENARSTELAGWNGTDELTRQVIMANASGNYYGSAFSGLAKMTEDLKDPQGSTEYLLKYFAGKINEVDANTDLTISSPKKNSFVTYEENQQFRMKFDPNMEVLLNGEKVVPSERGGASVWVPLKVGKNEIKLQHKGKTTTFNIERKVEIFKTVSPTKAMKVPGGSTVEFNVMAYKGSEITATLNGQTVKLNEGGGDDVQLDSNYVNFYGSLKVGKSTAKEQPIGTITFKGSYQGYPETAKGSAITIDKLLDEVDPDTATGQVFQHAVVKSNYANTYPFQSAPEYPQGILYPLPQGTQDIVQSVSGNYLHLRSGKTIHKNTVDLQDIAFEGNNAITQLQMGVEGNDTVIRATMNWKSPFSLDLSPYPNSPEESYTYGATTVTLLLDYTTMLNAQAVTGDMSSSPIFSGVSYKRVFNESRKIYQYQITLPLAQTGRYYGCYADWEDNTLVFRFNHGPSSGSLSGLRIMVDPGHGGNDNGTMAGSDVLEKEVNLPQAFALRDALQALGAEVVMLREGDNSIATEARGGIAQANRVDLFISVHHNSAGANPTPHGVETYYNTPFSQPLARAVQSRLEGVMPPSQWNKSKFYNFAVAREKQYPSILIECGYLSNPEDEARAMDSYHHQAMAEAIAQGVVDYYS